MYWARGETPLRGVGAHECGPILTQWCGGDMVSVCLEPAEATYEMFGLLYKPGNGIFDVRCRDPKPGLRILGGYGEKDWFVALTLHPRSVAVDFSSRPPLGPYGSVDWANAIHETQTEWKSLFGDIPPITGQTKDVFLSNVTPD